MAALSKSRITAAAAIASCDDLLRFSFAENKNGISVFAEALFKAGQDCSIDYKVNVMSALPSGRTVRKAVCELESANRVSFKALLTKRPDTFCGGMSNDGVTMKVQEKHFLI